MGIPYILILYLDGNKIGTLYGSIIPRVGEYINLRDGKDIKFGGNKLFQIKKVIYRNRIRGSEMDTVIEIYLNFIKDI